MSASLVGSEMCIRDRPSQSFHVCIPSASGGSHSRADRRPSWQTWTSRTVSYTHLTLPTICSV
eukprot:4102739-Alexandrium_andersonii.AAC.1